MATPIRVLCIGDPHFKPDNKLETDLMTEQIAALAAQLAPTFIVVLGDLLHSFEKIDLYSERRVIHFLRTIRPLSSHLYVIIGNHDRPNNRIYQTDEHPFNALKEWPSTTVVDTACVATHLGNRFAFIPYVEPSRFKEALASAGLTPPYSNISCIFAHQEFKGAKMNAITSEEGDPWDPQYPLCVSGHIHDFDHLLPNLVYIGTPIQHTYGTILPDLVQTVSLFTFTPSEPRARLESHDRYPLEIPLKLSIKLTPEELTRYTPPPNARVKIKVIADAETLTAIMKLDHVKQLLAMGVKIKTVIANPVSVAQLPQAFAEARLRVPFAQRLKQVITSELPELEPVYSHLFIAHP